MGFASNSCEARQASSATRLFVVNGKVVNIPHFNVKVEDVGLLVRESENRPRIVFCTRIRRSTRENQLGWKF